MQHARLHVHSATVLQQQAKATLLQWSTQHGRNRVCACVEAWKHMQCTPGVAPRPHVLRCVKHSLSEGPRRAAPVCLRRGTLVVAAVTKQL